MREREINRLTALLSTEGRPLQALAEDCCYRNVKQLHESVNQLEKENSVLKIKLSHCEKAKGEKNVQKGVIGTMLNPGNDLGNCVHKMRLPCDTHINHYKKSCEEVHRELKEKDKVINDLQLELQRCTNDARNAEMMNQLSEKLADRVKCQDNYVEALSQHQKILRDCNKRENPLIKAVNNENDPLQRCRVGIDSAEMSGLRKDIESMRKQLEDMTIFHKRQDNVRSLQGQLMLKDSEISTLKNKSYLSASSMLDGSGKCGSDRSWRPDCQSGCMDKTCMQREHAILTEELKRLTCERDHLKRQLDSEVEKFCIEREALNNTLDKLRCRLENVERDNRDLLSKQEPKNAAIQEMQRDVKNLRCQIDMLREDNEKLQVLLVECVRREHESFILI